MAGDHGTIGRNPGNYYLALLLATDRAARQRRVNRSALVREALKEHLRRLATPERERRDRAGYEARPFDDEVSAGWDRIAVWPDK